MSFARPLPPPDLYQAPSTSNELSMLVHSRFAHCKRPCDPRPLHPPLEPFKACRDTSDDAPQATTHGVYPNDFEPKLKQRLIRMTRR